MNGYNILKTGDKYCFEFIPGNSHNQAIGRSKQYNSVIECLEALKEFKNIVYQNNINSINSEFVVLEKMDDKMRMNIIYNDEIIYSSRYYTGNSKKENCKKTIKSIHKNIDEYTTNIRGENHEINRASIL